ncbi:MAG: methyltransferase domain-containing protein [Pseudonocardiaceae bacterium]|nr:methyltransferase domain-containing protein [Pseudonocardiaceae bacterium]
MTDVQQRRTLAQLVEALCEGGIPVRFTAYDGSSSGPSDAPIHMHLASPRGATYLATTPREPELGMARAYITGELELHGVHPGDPYPALHAFAEGFRLNRPAPADLVTMLRSLGWEALRPVSPPPQETRPRWQRIAAGWRHSRHRDSDAIHRHYDVSNAFYRRVLGDSMTYTCAVFEHPDLTLEAAQQAKHQLVFDKLGLEPGMRLLDVGCGWGGMVRHAARHGVSALGVTLSAQQASWAQAAIDAEGLGELAEIRHLDYRDAPGHGYDAIASIGLTEHIGVRRYPGYFASLLDRLRPGGRLLNHSITRPTNHARVKTGAFIDRYVFPDGELTGSGRIITEAQDAGFEVRHSENLREHYALTLAGWCANLTANWEDCVAEVGEASARIWGLYMAASRLAFERNEIQLHQVLAVRPGSRGRAEVPLRPWWHG